MLKLIHGGGKGGGGGGGRSRPGPDPDEGFQKHRLADYVWRALYPKPAHTFADIHDRVTRSFAKDRPGSPIPTAPEIARCILHIRANGDAYGWTIPHVQKGSGKLRLYFVALVDGDDSYIEPEYINNLRAGLYSSVSTMASMAEHEAFALEVVAGLDLWSRSQKRAMRGYEGQLLAIKETAGQILHQLEK